MSHVHQNQVHLVLSGGWAKGIQYGMATVQQRMFCTPARNCRVELLLINPRKTQYAVLHDIRTHQC